MPEQNPNPSNCTVPVWGDSSAQGFDKANQIFVATLCGNESIQEAIEHVRKLISAHSPDNGDLSSVNNCVGHIRFSASAQSAWNVFQHALDSLTDVDIAIQPLATQSKKLLICDMDKTIVDAETLDEVAELVGIGAQVARITEQAMRGDIDFYDALRERILLLKGQPRSVFLDVFERCPLNPGAEKLIAQANRNGLTTILISGGFADIANPVGKSLGFDHVFCNQLDFDNEQLTGKVLEPLVDAKHKRNKLQQFMRELNLNADDCCAIGDGANDIPMLETAGLGVAYYGKPLTQQATAYRINFSSLESAIYFMGLE